MWFKNGCEAEYREFLAQSGLKALGHPADRAPRPLVEGEPCDRHLLFIWPGTKRTLRGAAIQIAAAETTQHPIARRNASL